MTASLFNNQNGPLGNVIDGTVYPQFLNAKRAPTTADVYPAGTRWLDTSVSPPILYENLGVGSWVSGGVNHATSTTYGSVILTDDSEPVATKVYVDGVAIAGAPVATTTVQGIVTLATNAEAVAGTASTSLKALSVQPSNLVSVFAAPPAMGGTTPSTGAFTTLAFTTLSGSAGGDWLSGGTAINVGSDASNDAVNIGTAGTRTVTIGSVTSTSSTVINSGTGALNIGTSIAKTITIGNVTTTTAVAINSGTGGVALVSTSTGDITATSGDKLLLDAAGVLELNSSAGVISIGNDAVSQDINIGTAGTRLITIGNTTASTEVLVNVGTNGLVVDGVATSTYAIAESTTSGTITIGGTAQTGNMVFGSSSGNYQVDIADSTATGVATLNLATGVNGNTINIGTGINTSSQTINIATGASAAASNVNILTGVGSASTAALRMANNTRVTAIDLGNIAPAATRLTTICGGNQGQNDSVLVLGGAATANTQTFSVLSGVGSGTHAKVLNLCNSTMSAGTATVNILSGTATGGTLALNIVGDSASATVVTTKLCTGAAAHVLTIGNAASGAQTWNVGTGNLSFVGGGNTINIAADVASNTVNIGTGAAAANTINIGGTGANTVAIANTQTAGSLSLAHTMTTGNIVIGDAQTSGTFTMGSLGAGTGLVTLFGGTGAQTINLASNTGVKTINIAGTGATSANVINIGTGGTATQTVTIGSTSSASVLTLNAGSGDVKVTGSNLEIATTGKGLLVKGGAATDMIGTGVLTAGTQTIANTNVKTGDLIFLSRISPAASAVLGELSYTIIDSTSFTVTSLGVGTGTILVGDVSTYCYMIVRPT